MRWLRRKPAQPAVTDVAMEGKDIAAISFDDGHIAKFWAYRKAYYTQYEGLHRFFLYAGETLVAQYDGQLREPSGYDDEYRFVYFAEGYTSEHVILYWETAHSYLEKQYMNKRKPPEELRLPWIVCEKARSDLQRIGGDWIRFNNR